MTTNTAFPRRGWLQLQGWHGRTQQEVVIVGHTAKRLRIRALKPTRLAGRRRTMLPGDTCLVPNYAVRDAKVPGVAEC